MELVIKGNLSWESLKEAIVKNIPLVYFNGLSKDLSQLWIYKNKFSISMKQSDSRFFIVGDYIKNSDSFSIKIIKEGKDNEIFKKFENKLFSELSISRNFSIEGD